MTIRTLGHGLGPAMLLCLAGTIAACAPAGSAADSSKEAAATAHAQEPDPALAFRNARRPLPGLVTGGQPDSAALAALAAEGMRIVLDLRTPGEPRGMDEARVVQSLGMRYVNLPVRSDALDETLFEVFRQEMAGADSVGVVVHCASGNRVGGMMIPYLMLDRGMSAQEADSVARAMGLRSDAIREAAHAYVRGEGEAR